MDVFDKCGKGKFVYQAVRRLQKSGYYFFFREIQSPQDSEVIVGGRRTIMVGSNNYLGLTCHPRVKEAAIKAVKKYGSGCAGSRFLNGNLEIHVELEHKLAKFFRQESALVFATGYQTNLGTISALVGRSDVAILDKYNHASLIDGCRLSFGKMLKYKHNNMADLERLLKVTKDKGKLIIIDGIFSMEGDIANLPEIIKLARHYGARVMLDDAHGVGVLGKTGRGTAEHFGLENQVDLIMGTYSKSLAAIGGFVVGDQTTINYINIRPAL